MSCSAKTKKGLPCKLAAAWGQNVCPVHGAVKPHGYVKVNIPGQVETSPYAVVDAPVEATRVYTDGACSPNPGVGGWAWVVKGSLQRHAYGWAPHTTNQRMEILAALEAVRNNSGPLVIVSDSMYVVQCFRDEWWKKWVANNWTRGKAVKVPVKHADLWAPLVDLVTARSVAFQWVRGHNGDVWNEHADTFATRAARGRSHAGVRTAAVPVPMPAPVPVVDPDPVLTLW